MKFSSTAWKRLRDAYANKNEPESFRVLTQMYWHALLYGTIFAVLIAVSYGLWQSVNIFSAQEEASLLVTGEARAPILNRTQLNATVQGFKDREVQYEYLKANPPRVADPSR